MKSQNEYRMPFVLCIVVVLLFLVSSIYGEGLNDGKSDITDMDVEVSSIGMRNVSEVGEVSISREGKGLEESGNVRGRKCRRRDVLCEAKRALELTNEIRRKNGVKEMLVLGTQAQMINAMKHARFLSKLGRLKHQKLADATRKTRCERFIGGENLAAHDYEDVAGVCVKAWKNSPGHFANLIRPWYKEMVMGVVWRGHRAYCVQTFAIVLKNHRQTFGKFKGPKCHKARGPRS